MKPSPAKPRIIIAHVEGSGAAAANSISGILKLERLSSADVKVAEVNGVADVMPKNPKVLVSKVVTVFVSEAVDASSVNVVPAFTFAKIPTAVTAVGNVTVKLSPA